MGRYELRRFAAPLLIIAVTLGAATLSVGFLQDSLGVPNPSAVYLVAVVAAALVGGTVGAIATSIGAFLLYNYFFTDPRHTLAMHEPGAWLSVVLLLFVGVVVGQLAAVMRARTQTASLREREARALFRVSRALATRVSTDAALAEICAILHAETRMQAVLVALGSASERIVARAGEDDDVKTSAMPAYGVVNVLRRMPGEEPARWVRVHQAGVRHVGSRGLDAYQVRIELGAAILGSVWAARPRDKGQPTYTETRLLSAAADQIGQALTQDRLAAESRTAEIARQSDALKSALLQSVSHDLRSPLATIRAAAGTLAAVELDGAARRESVDAIDRETQYLNRLVTNLVDLSRIEVGALRADRDAFELDDLLTRALERLRPRLAERALEVDIAAPPVLVDPVLLDEAVANVLENVVRHTPDDAPVRIRARAVDGGQVRMTIEDGGQGVPADAMQRVFEKFYRVPGQTGARGGTGIGLAVVRGMVEAMGGSVDARRSELGGLAVDIDLIQAVLPAELVAAGSAR